MSLGGVGGASSASGTSARTDVGKSRQKVDVWGIGAALAAAYLGRQAEIPGNDKFAPVVMGLAGYGASQVGRYALSQFGGTESEGAVPAEATGPTGTEGAEKTGGFDWAGLFGKAAQFASKLDLGALVGGAVGLLASRATDEEKNGALFTLAGAVVGSGFNLTVGDAVNRFRQPESGSPPADTGATA